MSIKSAWLSPQAILCLFLFVVLLVVGYFYYQSTTSANASIAVDLPTSVKADVLSQQQQTAANTSSPNSSSEKQKPRIAITPEEKRVVEEKEYLENIVAEGDKKINDLRAAEDALFQQDEDAKAIIAKLDAQVEGVSK